MFGENLGTGTLTETLARVAIRIAEDRDDDRPTDEDMVWRARQLMEGATVLWLELTKEQRGEARPTARRKVASFGSVGKCSCGLCNWPVSRYDGFCRRCGAEFTGTDFDEGGDDA